MCRIIANGSWKLGILPSYSQWHICWIWEKDQYIAFNLKRRSLCCDWYSWKIGPLNNYTCFGDSKNKSFWEPWNSSSPLIFLPTLLISTSTEIDNWVSLSLFQCIMAHNDGLAIKKMFHRHPRIILHLDQSWWLYKYRIDQKTFLYRKKKEYSLVCSRINEQIEYSEFESNNGAYT